MQPVPKNLTYNRGALFGDSCFTTLLGVAGRPVFLTEHVERLIGTAQYLGIHTEINEAQCAATIASLPEKYAQSRIRLTVSRTGADISPLIGTDHAAAFSVQHSDLPEHPLAPQTLRLSPYRIPADAPTTGFKTGSYLDKVLALKHVRSMGAAEGVQLNTRGHLVSGIMSNLFWVENNIIYTPDLSTGCLPGIVRQKVLNACRQLSIPAKEVTVDAGALHRAEACFITSSLRGVASMNALEARQFPQQKHPLVQALKNRIDTLQQESLGVNSRA